MKLTPQAVDAYRQILSNPSKYGFSFPPLKDCFEESETVTAQHILFVQLIAVIKVGLHKLMFYILMDELYGPASCKDEKGNLGYKLKIKSQ